MRVWEVILLVLITIILFFGLYVLWVNLPRQGVGFEEYNPEIMQNFANKSVQFYPNMRFPDKTITYTIEYNCRNGKTQDIDSALKRISEKTVLEFESSENGQIKFLCSQVAPPAQENNHFVAGEGGPTKIINATKFSVIYEAEVSLFRAEKCDKPQIATHEILHAIGFDHNNNKSSIMYPVTDCEQVIDSYISDEINRLYGFEGLPDLAITYLEANRTGRYINFEVGISNIGLKDSRGSVLIVYADETNIKKFDMGVLNIGERKTYSVTNARGPSSFDKLRFEINTTFGDLDYSNNRAELIAKS